MPYILKYSDNYADEFDVEGFQLLNDKTGEKLKNYFTKIKKVDYTYSFGFGSNEDIEITSFLDVFSIEKINSETEKIISKTIGEYFGIIPDVDNIIEFIENESIFEDYIKDKKEKIEKKELTIEKETYQLTFLTELKFLIRKLKNKLIKDKS